MENSAIVSLESILQITAVVLAGLVAGLFYGYDCSVIRGLGNLPNREYLSAFQSINKAILTPYFFISFLGCLVVLPIATWMIYYGSSTIAFYFLLAATVIYVIGVFGITAFGNVPLNNTLEVFDISNANSQIIQDLRLKFENNWNMLHHIRTYAAILVFLLTIISLAK